MDVGSVAPQRMWHQGTRASALSQLYGLHGDACGRRVARLTEESQTVEPSASLPQTPSPNLARNGWFVCQSASYGLPGPLCFAMVILRVV